MEENSDQKIELKDRIVFFLKKNKFKLITLIFFILIIIFFFMFIKIQNEKKGNLISEKYITAGLYLSSNENEKSKAKKIQSHYTFEGDPCDTTYSVRCGKYQHQPERVTLAKI